MAAVTGIPDTSTFNDAELAFLEGVFTYQGIDGRPTEDEFKHGLAVMSDYARQVQDNPPEDESDAPLTLGIHSPTDDEWLKIAAAVYMRFGVTKPNSWQWHEAYEQFFAPASRPAAS